MKNYIQPGKTVTVIAGGTVASGDPVLSGSIFGVAAYGAVLNDEVELDTEGVFELPKITTDDIGVGDKLYWDAGNSKLTKTAGTGSKPLVGFATKAAGNGVTTVQCSLRWTGATGPA